MKNNFIWNVLGSSAVAIFTVAITLVISAFGELNEIGIFSIGMALANLIYSVATFGIRNYQASDVRGEYEFSDYYYTRLGTCLLAICMSIALIFQNGYELQVGIVVLILCMYKVIDALSDVYQGMFQLNGRLDIAGKSNFIRVVASIVTYIIIYAITRSLIYGCLAMVIINIILVFMYDIKQSKQYISQKNIFNFSKIKGILKDTVTLFITLFLLTYIVNSSKYAIDTFMGLDAQAIYNIVFLPSLVINLGIEFVLRPILGDLAVKWEKVQIKAFLKQILIIIILTLVCGIVGVVASNYIGLPILEILYGVSLETYRGVFLLLMTSAGINAVGRVITYALITMRQQNLLLVSYIIGAISAYILTMNLVEKYGMIGAAIGNLGVNIILTIILSIILVTVSLRKYNVDQNKELDLNE